MYINEKPKYILQRINTIVFKNVENIFHNIDLIQSNKVDIGVKFIRSKSKNSLFIDTKLKGTVYGIIANNKTSITI